MTYYYSYAEPEWDSDNDSTWEEDEDYHELKRNRTKWRTSWKRSGSSRASADLRRYRHGYPEPMPNLHFYRNEIPFQPNGVSIEDIHYFWKDDYKTLEINHSYIQWLFPLREPGMNHCALPLTVAELQEMRKDEEVMRRFLESYKLMLGFYGIQLVDEETGKVARAENWENRFYNMDNHTHNNLRITRILKCLGEMGYQHYQAPLVRFFLEETLCHGNLQYVKRSVLDYFMFTVKDRKERKELVLFAWEHYEPKRDFIWGPVEVLQKLKPFPVPCEEEYDDDIKEPHREDYDDDSEQPKREDDDNDIKKPRREDDDNDIKKPEREDDDNDIKEPGREDNDIKELKSQVSDQDNIHEIKTSEGQNDSTNTSGLYSVEGLENHNTGAGENQPKESEYLEQFITSLASPSCDSTERKPGQEQNEGMKQTGIPDNKDQYKDEQENDSKLSKDVTNLPRTKENKGQNKDSENKPSGEISNSKSDIGGENTDAEKEYNEVDLIQLTDAQGDDELKHKISGEIKESKETEINEAQSKNNIQEENRKPSNSVGNNTGKEDNEDQNSQPSGEIDGLKEEKVGHFENREAGKVAKQEHRENDSVQMTGLECAKELKKNKSGPQDNHEREQEKQVLKLASPSCNSTEEKAKNDLEKPLEEDEKQGNNIQGYSEQSDHDKDKIDEGGKEGNKDLSKDHTNKPSRDIKDKDLKDNIDVENKDAGKVCKRFNSGAGSLHLDDLPMKKNRAEEKDQTPLTEQGSQTQNDSETPLCLECTGSSLEGSTKVTNVPFEDIKQVEGKGQENFKSGNVELAQSNEPTSCCKDENSSGALAGNPGQNLRDAKTKSETP